MRYMSEEEVKHETLSEREAKKAIEETESNGFYMLIDG